ncbi:hypothetical protein [Sphaerisporangium rhizosphaerae]|uniref:Uncharacterized protein n=1 Tax=Sphaerisporangium rhizosphaerae TaxID=2269375 RepID=A0ABW2P197_9ACTN
MAYSGTSALVDWASLRSVQLLDADGSYRTHNLGQVVETLTDWREFDGPDLRDLAPGEPPVPASLIPMAPALAGMAAGLAGGLTVNAIYDMLKKVAGVG